MKKTFPRSTRPRVKGIPTTISTTFLRLATSFRLVLWEHLEADGHKVVTSGQSSQLSKHLHHVHLSRRCRSFEYRLHYLKRIGYLLQDNAEAICESVMLDLGRKYDDTKNQEAWVNNKAIDRWLTFYIAMHRCGSVCERSI